LKQLRHERLSAVGDRLSANTEWKIAGSKPASGRITERFYHPRRPNETRDPERRSAVSLVLENPETSKNTGQFPAGGQQ
jgi:hypothetical protein